MAAPVLIQQTKNRFLEEKNNSIEDFFDIEIFVLYVCNFFFVILFIEFLNIAQNKQHIFF